MPDALRVERFETKEGVQIFRLPLQVFSGYVAYAHLVAADGALTLIDVGSGFASSHRDLITGFDTVRERFGVPARLEELDRIIITHGHIDHFGGLGKVKQSAERALVGLHELARQVLVNYDERVLLSAANMNIFLQRAGVPDAQRRSLLSMYMMMGRRAFLPVPVDFLVEDGGVLDGAFQFIHVPGHAPGLVMIQVGEILLTADHILPETSVVIAPESIRPYTGVGHYLQSVDKAERAEGIEVALGGHEQPMNDYYDVVARVRAETMEKIEHVLSHCGEPRTVYEIACRIYDDMAGYGELLKVEQTGARVEYLHQRGILTIANLVDLEKQEHLPLRYRQV